VKYEYFVVPYFDQLVQGEFTTESAQVGCQQLQHLLNHYAGHGWEYYRTEEVVAHINAGCLAALFGQGTKLYRYKQIVFRKSSSVE
jgi:hypothetical protein